MLQIFLYCLISIIIYFLWLYKEKDELYIGRKVYYYLHDQTKIYTGRIMAIIKCDRIEDITHPTSALRIIADSDRKIKKSAFTFVEIQPILGGDRILLSEHNIMKELKK